MLFRSKGGNSITSQINKINQQDPQINFEKKASQGRSKNQQNVQQMTKRVPCSKNDSGRRRIVQAIQWNIAYRPSCYQGCWNFYTNAFWSLDGIENQPCNIFSRKSNMDIAPLHSSQPTDCSNGYSYMEVGYKA